MWWLCKGHLSQHLTISVFKLPLSPPITQETSPRDDLFCLKKFLDSKNDFRCFFIFQINLQVSSRFFFFFFSPSPLLNVLNADSELWAHLQKSGTETSSSSFVSSLTRRAPCFSGGDDISETRATLRNCRRLTGSTSAERNEPGPLPV